MMSYSIKAYSFCISLICLVLATGSCNNASAPIEDEAPVITPVSVVPVEYKPVSETVDLPAVTIFISKSIVRCTITGTVESTSVAPGDRVQKDQLLYTIRSRESSALSNSLKGDSTLSFSGRVKISASGEGIISSVTHQTGDFVQEGDELAVISAPNSLVFILETPFDLVRYIEQNRICKITLPDRKVITGNISGKLAEMDPQAQTVRYMIRPIVQGFLPSNLNAVVSIVKSNRNNAAVLPKEAVLSNETQTEFWIMKLINDSTAVKVPVTKGYENNEEVEITGPEFLKTDRIVLTGGYGLPDTARVIIK
jgi:multidrug efflux pump subunit AcrA (membrane-fusion protein)